MEVSSAVSPLHSGANPSNLEELPARSEQSQSTIDRLRRNAEILTDSEGRHSEEAQYSAWREIISMSRNGQLSGLGEEDKALLAKARESDIRHKVDDLHNQLIISKSQADTRAGRLDATLNFYDSLTGLDQKILFDSVLNQPGANGEPRYASVDQWRQVFESEIQLADTVQQARENGGYSPGQDIDDPKLAEAVRLAGSSHMTDNEAWLAQVRDLFGVSQPVQDKVDLSLDAQKAMGPAHGETDLALLQSTQAARIDQKV